MPATASQARTARVRSLPTLSQAAEFIGLDSGGMSRIVRSLRIEPQAWGRRDKHLDAAQVLQIASVAQRASLEEVAGSIIEWTEKNHPGALGRTRAEIDRFFAQLPQVMTTPAEQFVAELHAALPERWVQLADASEPPLVLDRSRRVLPGLSLVVGGRLHVQGPADRLDPEAATRCSST